MQRNQPDNVLGLKGTRYLLTLGFVAPTSSTTMTSAGKGAQGTMRSLIENQGFSHTLVQEGTFHPTALIFKWSLAELGHPFKHGWRTGSEAGN